MKYVTTISGVLSGVWVINHTWGVKGMVCVYGPHVK